MIMISDQEEDDPARRGSTGKPRAHRPKKPRKGNPVHRGTGGQEPAPGGGNPTAQEPKDADEPRTPEGAPGPSPSVSEEEGPENTPFPPEQ